MYNKKAKKPSLFYSCYKRVVTSTFKKKIRVLWCWSAMQLKSKTLNCMFMTVKSSEPKCKAKFYLNRSIQAVQWAA